MEHNCKYDAAVKTLQDLVKVQCSNGNFDYDPYMHGMANGLICALACVKGERAEYISAPEQWLKDKHVASKFADVSQSTPNSRSKKRASK